MIPNLRSQKKIKIAALDFIVCYTPQFTKLTQKIKRKMNPTNINQSLEAALNFSGCCIKG